MNRSTSLVPVAGGIPCQVWLLLRLRGSLARGERRSSRRHPTFNGQCQDQSVPETPTDHPLSDPLRVRAAAALDVPLAGALGCRLLDEDRPDAGAWFEAGALAGNGAGGVHASALDALMELAGFLAVSPTLTADEHAVTVNSTVSLLQGAASGARIEARGELDRRTRRLAFLGVEVTSGGELVARAQLVKAVIPSQ